MATTLKPILEALDYRTERQQRDFVKLLHAARAYGDIPDVPLVLDDCQASALLEQVSFDSKEQAAKWLHDVTQETMIRRPQGVERHQVEEPQAFVEHRGELLPLLDSLNLNHSGMASHKHYDHVLLLGATEPAVDERFDQLQHMHERGVRFDKIHLLGSARALDPSREASAGQMGIDSRPMQTEMEMMESRYYAKSSGWSSELQDVRLFEVNTLSRRDGQRPNTQDTVKAWKATDPRKGSVLVISSQPHVVYQDAAVKSVLGNEYQVDTVGAEASKNTKIVVAMDSVARRIDVGYEQLLQKLRKPEVAPTMELAALDPATIESDPVTYQFRSGGDAKGVTHKGRFQADRWDAVLHGDPIMVHERKDGKLFVADGHHRLDLAKRLNAEGKGPGKIYATILRESDGYSAQDVKVIAAYKNIAHGKCDPVDTAKVFKEARSVKQEWLPHLQMDKGNLRMSYKLSGLSDKALEPVAKGDVPIEMGAELADRVKDPARQEAVIGIIARKLKQEYPIMDADPYHTHVQAMQVPLPRIERGSVQFKDGTKWQYENIIPTQPEPAGFVQKLAMQRQAKQQHSQPIVQR